MGCRWRLLFAHHPLEVEAEDADGVLGVDGLALGVGEARDGLDAHGRGVVAHAEWVVATEHEALGTDRLHKVVEDGAAVSEGVEVELLEVFGGGAGYGRVQYQMLAPRVLPPASEEGARSAAVGEDEP